jgi:hypothetical protein
MTELDTLIANQKRRQNAVELYKDFINNMVEPNDNGKPKKGITYRKWLKNRLQYGANKIFDDEEKEYEFVGKFGSSGSFDGHMINQFSKIEQKIIIELAKEYGAFDY